LGKASRGQGRDCNEEGDLPKKIAPSEHGSINALEPSTHLRMACANARQTLVDHDVAVPVAGMTLPEVAIVGEPASCANAI